MTFKNVSGVLPNNVAFTGNFASPYPAGTSRGDYLGGRGHQLAVGQNVYADPGQMTVELGGQGVLVTNNTQATWPEGETFVLSLNMLGQSAGWPAADGKPMPRVKPWPVVYLNLGSPLPENEEGLCAAAMIAGAGPVVLAANRFDVPRNLIIHSDAVETAIFTVTSLDEYGQKVVEEIVGADHGYKAHFTNIQVIASEASVGNVSIGWGLELGLPCFISSNEVVQKELQDGAEAAAGGLTGGDTDAASATSGDVRGTYEPSLPPDGTMSYGLLVCIPDPSYQGITQFAG